MTDPEGPQRAWPMPDDAQAHRLEALQALSRAEDIARTLGGVDDVIADRALLQVRTAQAKVHATLAAAAVEMQAAGYMVAAAEDEEESDAEHAGVCAGCRARAMTVVKDEVERYLDATEGVSDDSTETAADVARIVERVLFGVAAPPLPPASYRDQEG